MTGLQFTMQCNIDAKGKAARLISGILVTLIGTVLLVLGLTDVIAGDWIYILVAVLLIAGLFQIYEGRSGWCVMRAMGFKTPM